LIDQEERRKREGQMHFALLSRGKKPDATPCVATKKKKGSEKKSLHLLGPGGKGKDGRLAIAPPLINREERRQDAARPPPEKIQEEEKKRAETRSRSVPELKKNSRASSLKLDFGRRKALCSTSGETEKRTRNHGAYTDDVSES